MFVEKVRDIAGPYLNPPENAMVFSVDEKSQCQALERAQPVLPWIWAVPNTRHTTTSGIARPRCSLRWKSLPEKS